LTLANLERSRDAKPRVLTRETGKDSRVAKRRAMCAGFGGAQMKWMPLLLAALLPSVLSAGVTVITSPATVETYVGKASDAMQNGDYITAWAFFECALMVSPSSSEAIFGLSVARAGVQIEAGRPSAFLGLAVY
jgi:hypothetical protein